MDQNNVRQAVTSNPRNRGARAGRRSGKAAMAEERDQSRPFPSGPLLPSSAGGSRHAARRRSDRRRRGLGQHHALSTPSLDDFSGCVDCSGFCISSKIQMSQVGRRRRP